MKITDIKDIQDCLEILTDKSCNYQKTALRLQQVLQHIKTHKIGAKNDYR